MNSLRFEMNRTRTGINVALFGTGEATGYLYNMVVMIKANETGFMAGNSRNHKCPSTAILAAKRQLLNMLQHGDEPQSIDSVWVD